jgi:hypothetical protein
LTESAARCGGFWHRMRILGFERTASRRRHVSRET